MSRASMTRLRVRGTCPHDCPDTCGVATEVQDGRAAGQVQRSICGAAAEFAVGAPPGKRWSQPYAAVVHSKLVIVWGHNPVSTAPHFMPFLRQAQRRGCQLVVIDPRRTRTAEGA